MPALVLIAGVVGVVVLALWSKSQASGDSGSYSVSGAVAAILGGDSVAPVTDGGANDPISIALPVIRKFEGFATGAYEDPQGSGKFSIGYGHQIRPGDPYNSASAITEGEATDVLRVDVGSAWTCVYQNVKVDCSPQQYAALISLCFNIGCNAFKSSTLVRDLNNGDIASAADQFSVWNKVGGQISDALVQRRQDEQQLFQSGTVA